MKQRIAYVMALILGAVGVFGGVSMPAHSEPIVSEDEDDRQFVTELYQKYKLMQLLVLLHQLRQNGVRIVADG